MRKSTIKLTKHELDFASSTLYPETKQSVMLKMQQLFMDCGQKLNQNDDYQLLAGTEHFKISKGEQYKNLPYMVLDCPKISGPSFKMVLRTMFWWGHYISCNLILRTDMLQKEQNLVAILKLKKTKVLIGDHLWEQDLAHKDYFKLSELSVEKLTQHLQSAKYLKLSRKIPLHQYEYLPKKMEAIYAEWITLLSIKKGAD